MSQSMCLHMRAIRIGWRDGSGGDRQREDRMRHKPFPTLPAAACLLCGCVVGLWRGWLLLAVSET